MTHAIVPLLAEETTRTAFEWGRIQSNSDWILPIAVCIAILMFVRFMAKRDAAELHPAVGWILTALRAATFLGLLILYLQPHWRLEHEVEQHSRALLLVDTSLSMGQTDADSASVDQTRDQQVAAALQNSDFLDRLRKTHDVAVYQFSEDLNHDRVISLPKIDASHEKESAGRQATQSSPTSETDTASPADEPPLDWAKQLAARGTETRLGQSLRQLIHDERSSPVSGVVLFSDGGQNAGISADAAIALAQEAHIPVFTIGIGSDRQPSQVRISDFVVPARAYPGDHYTVTGYLQSQGMAGKTVTVQILSRSASAQGNAPSAQEAGEVVESREVTLGGDGEIQPVKFELTPDAPGRRTISFRIEKAESGKDADHLREADIEIVDRKNHVLLFAGGPTREYQFLRSQLHRDRSTSLDVLLQTGQEGMSQEAKKILTEFPDTREQMFDYDCLVCFDPNWQALDANQLEILDSWVAEQGGGLILIAGPVCLGKTINGWLQDPAMKTVHGLYPIEFPRRLASMETTIYNTSEPWPLEFTPDGLEAEFLWLGDTAAASREAWKSFPGVYSCCLARGAKPGATVYARFSDPRASQGTEQAVYFAGQFYGSGRVFYMGSGEMWRTRAVDDACFEQFYTKLIRHVSQGRLLRGSSRGTLLVGQDRYLIGNTVEIRAQLTNARLEPLDIPNVNVEVFGPGEAAQSVVLRRDPARAGAYVGQFQAIQEGTYRLELLVPESDRERLVRRIQVLVPDLERENPRRNDALLSAIAKNTGGKYYIGASAISAEGPDSLVSLLPDRTNTVIQTAASDPQSEETWLRWMTYILCGLLCLEWLIRRLSKLA